jgi:hypothetical protein
MMNSNQNRVWRPVLAGITVLAIMAGVFSFAPTRAVARQLLSVFRVRKFAAIQVSPDESQMEALGEALEDTIFAQEPEIVADGPETETESIDEAREAAGFDVRVPEYWPGDDPVTIHVKGYSELAFNVTGDGLRLLVDMADMDTERVPADMGEETVTLAVPAIVQMYTPEYHVWQMYNPVVDYPEGIDPRFMGEVALRLLGMPPEEAERFSDTIDWTNTVVIPIPSDVSEFVEVTIAGEDGVLLRPRDMGADSTGRTLLWRKGDVVYAVAGKASSQTLIQIAESMF